MGDDGERIEICQALQDALGVNSGVWVRREDGSDSYYDVGACGVFQELWSRPGPSFKPSFLACQMTPKPFPLIVTRADQCPAVINGEEIGSRIILRSTGQQLAELPHLIVSVLHYGQSRIYTNECVFSLLPEPDPCEALPKDADAETLKNAAHINEETSNTSMGDQGRSPQPNQDASPRKRLRLSEEPIENAVIELCRALDGSGNILKQDMPSKVVTALDDEHAIVFASRMDRCFHVFEPHKLKLTTWDVPQDVWGGEYLIFVRRNVDGEISLEGCTCD